MRAFIDECLDRVLAGGKISIDEGERLLNAGPSDFMHLLAAASRVRLHFIGDEVHLCSIVNAKSGRCSEDCGFCSQSSQFTTGVEEYDLLPEGQASVAGKEARSHGAEALGLVAAWRGLKQGKQLDAVIERVREVSQDGAVHADASLGLIDDPEVARQLKEAGLHTYNHNLETARSHFDEVVASHDYDERLQTLKIVRDAGIHLCSGGIVGMGESLRQRAELAAELREVDPDMVPLNFLNPIEGTPMAEQHEPMAAIDALKCIAMFRMMLPGHQIMVAGGREVVLGDLAPLMYMAGASATMVGNYLTTSGTPAGQDVSTIRALGLSLRTDGRSDLPESPRPLKRVGEETEPTSSEQTLVAGA
ncbi:MAG: biotin synthase [Pseudohongiellaceae bacterium]|jgi:biotin synthase